MAITFEKLQELLRQQNFRYYVASDQPVLRAGVQGLFGRYEFVIMLQDDGQFLQFRTVNYLVCSPESPHLPATLRVLAAINYRCRGTKLAWDKADGEVVAYIDTFLMDSDLTQNQLARIMNNFMPTIDIAYGRIRRTIETGNDPGDPDEAELSRRVAEASRQRGPGGDAPAAPEPPIREI